MERDQSATVRTVLLCGILGFTLLQLSTQSNSCSTPSVTQIDPAGDTISWADSAQHCTEFWYWVFKDKFSEGMGITIVINDLYVSDPDTVKIFDNTDIHTSYSARWFRSVYWDNAPVLLSNHQAVIVANTGNRSAKQGYSRFSFSLSAHPLSAIPPQVPLVSKTNDIGSRYRYNCSSPSDLPPALRCDQVRQCVGGEDEQQCGYHQPGCGDWLPYKDLCLRFVFSYVFIHKPHTAYDSTPLIAEESCRNTYRASLMAIPDPEDRAFVERVTKESGFQSIVVGLRKVKSMSERNGRLYRYMWQWGGPGGPIAYTEQRIQQEGFDEDCAIFNVVPSPEMTPTRCLFGSRGDGYVCSKPSPHGRRSQSTASHTLVLPPADKPLAAFPTKRCADLSLVQTFHPCPGLTESTKAGINGTLATTEHNLTTVPSGISDNPHAVDSVPELPAFQCLHGEGVHYSLTCDGFHDCPEGSDELECEKPQSIFFLDTFFVCKRTQIIPNSLKCNGVLDCLDSSDEEDCSRCNGPLDPRHMQMPCPQVGCVPSVYTKWIDNCPSLMVWDAELQDLEVAQVTLDGYGMYRLDPLGDVSVCPVTHFQCPGGYCIPTFLMNNGEQDCPHGEDESTPSADLVCPGFYRCQRALNCIHPDYICDGIPHCPFRDDELFCHLSCPSECQCQGFAFTCSVMFDVRQHLQVRYLDLSGAVGPSLVDLNVMEYLHFLNISSCHLHNITLKDLRHLRVLDLSHNFFTSLDSLELEDLGRLQYLDLSHNPLTQTVGSAFRAFLGRAGMVPLNTLAMRSTAVEYLQEDVFHVLQELVSLDLTGSPIDRFDIEVFQGLSQLQMLRTDNTRLCCSLPESSLARCEAPRDELSSCHDLLRSDFFRVFLWSASVLAITGNVAVFLYRLLKERGAHKGQAFPLLVQNLCVADCLMGVYLVIIGVADARYRGLYFTRDVQWRHSLACRVAGFLALLSSEVSAFLLCLITVDRLLVVRLPLHRHLHLTSSRALYACVVLWGVGFLLALTPLLPPTAHWDFYSQSAICLPLPITRQVFPGHQYTFSLFIVLNFFLFLLVGVGQVLIFRAIRKAGQVAVTATPGAGSQRRQQQEESIARRLFLVAFSDFCCWFPIGVLGLVAAGGVAIPGEVNVWSAVFVLPINSALNPFLYTLNTLLQNIRKRRREQKTQLMMQHLNAEIDRWPADRVQALVQHCVRKKLAGRDKTVITRPGTSSDAKKAEMDQASPTKDTVTTSLPTSATATSGDSQTPFQRSAHRVQRVESDPA